MKIQILPCSVVGGAFQVLRISRFGRRQVLARGLTKFEADCLKTRLTK